MVGDATHNPSLTDDHYWYYADYNTITYSWRVAADQLTFQLWYAPGGSWGNSYAGNIGNNQYNDANTGDIIAYDWGDGYGWSHVALEVGTGRDDTSGWVGDLVDAHTSDHLHAYWTLQPYNSKYLNTTTVRTMHISASN